MYLHPGLYLDSSEIPKLEPTDRPLVVYPKIRYFLLILLATIWVGVDPALGQDSLLDFSVKMPETSAQPNVKLTAPGTVAEELFKSKAAPGAVAIGVAEGNLTPEGDRTKAYSGHKDPGNNAINRGFCSWNGANKLTVEQADDRCLASLKGQSLATEKKLQELGVDPQQFAEVLVNGTDLKNQSPRAGADFPDKYQEAIAQGLTGNEATIQGRVESFRNEAGELSASGLFRICRQNSYYQTQLQALEPNSEQWRWDCIALDQGRRVRAVEKALNLHLSQGTFSQAVGDGLDFSGSSPTATQPPGDRALLNFEVNRVPDDWMEPSPTIAPRTPEPPKISTLNFQVEHSPAKWQEPATVDKRQIVTVTGSAGLNFTVRGPPPQGETRQTNATKEVFSGKAIAQTGQRFGSCRITDYRRFRSVSPVPGMPPRWHNGVDIGCGGTHAVYSPVTGTLEILPPEKTGGGGLVARIITKDGWTIQNMHMLQISAPAGEIKAGEKLGIGGAPKGHPNAGLGTGPHSHYERFQVVDGKRLYIDPTDTEIKALLGLM